MAPKIQPSLQYHCDQYKICVLIPTYNNMQHLGHVIDQVLSYTHNLIVVNDGSTDGTANYIQKNQPLVKLLTYNQNQGKGIALQKGFRYAQDLGYHYAITMDSDGQHYADDLQQFIDAFIPGEKQLMIGARNMDQTHIPGKSTFGNKFSNFWFWVETGIKLPDTQSGYRLYPLQEINSKRYYSSKYEFEIEAPVRAAWNGTIIKAVPVKVYYPPAHERITHFRPFKDFTRISILNTFLTFIALLWIHPRNFIKKIWSREGRKAIWENEIIKTEESTIRKASSIGFGVFMGIIPIWGFQLAVGIPLALALRLNKALFIIAANVSIFPITPVIWALSLIAGKWIMGYDDWAYDWKSMLTLDQFKEAGIAFFLGGMVLAIVASALAFGLSYIGIKKIRNR